MILTFHAWCAQTVSQWVFFFHLNDRNSFRFRHKFENQITCVYKMKLLNSFSFICLALQLRNYSSMTIAIAIASTPIEILNICLHINVFILWILANDKKILHTLKRKSEKSQNKTKRNIILLFDEYDTLNCCMQAI